MGGHGMVGPFEGSTPRQLLGTKAQWQELQMKRSGGGEMPPPEQTASQEPSSEPLLWDEGDGE